MQEIEVRLSLKLFNVHPDSLPLHMQQQVGDMVAADPVRPFSVLCLLGRFTLRAWRRYCSWRLPTFTSCISSTGLNYS